MSHPDILSGIAEACDLPVNDFLTSLKDDVINLACGKIQMSCAKEVVLVHQQCLSMKQICILGMTAFC